MGTTLMLVSDATSRLSRFNVHNEEDFSHHSMGL